MKILRPLTLVLSMLAICFVASAAWSHEEQDPALAKDVNGARVTLEHALQTTASQGRPISAKFERQEGKLQLSVYTMKSGKFSEILVDPKTGQIAKSEAITSGDDLKEAKEQSAAMAKTRQSLQAALTRALQRNKGYRAISITPSLKNGKAMASITLLRGEAFKTVSEQL